MARWPYSTARWQRLRKLVLRNEPLCRYCTELGYTTAATDVDHIKPVAQRRDLAFERSNLQPLCAACHSGAKQREDERGISIGCGADGVPRSLR